ncbi:hypothetical protein [Nocardioides sp.]|uniref:hypothetical protein n=1 Tax=Nocardioides sp. TaxID=35761 RepID=UPI0039E521E2
MALRSRVSMQEKIDAVVAALTDGLNSEASFRGSRSIRRLEGGVVALDFGDEDHVVRVTVERVARRRWKPEEPIRIGWVDGVEAEIVGVTVDDFVNVELAAVPGGERDRLSWEYNDAFEHWVAAGKDKRDDIPEQPASRLMQVGIQVRDDSGTSYSYQSGQFGGTGTEWNAIQSFGPWPSAEVHGLNIELQAPDGMPVVISVPL